MSTLSSGNSMLPNPLISAAYQNRGRNEHKGKQREETEIVSGGTALFQEVTPLYFNMNALLLAHAKSDYSLLKSSVFHYCQSSWFMYIDLFAV